jgi:hypothetical protein
VDKLYDRDEICDTYFFPQPDHPLPRAERAAPVQLDLDDGTPIGGYWSRPLTGAPTMLYLHGNGERIADQLEHWPQWARAAGANIFFVDYPGYASSAGRPTFSSCRQAARAALAYLRSQPEAEVPYLIVAGRSVGSIFALDVCAHAASQARQREPALSAPDNGAAAQVRGLMLESGIADLRPRLAMRVDYAALGIDREQIEAQLLEDFDHQRKISSLDCPVLILHTRDDSLVPSSNSELLARWAGEQLFKLVLFERGDHNTIQWLNQEAYRVLLGELLAELRA